MTANHCGSFPDVVSTVAIKAPVICATTGNITLSGLQTIDGVALAAGDRVLVKDQTRKTENGIYFASSGAWGRTSDLSGARSVVQGTFVSVMGGTLGASRQFRLSTASPVIGTTDIAFVDSTVVCFKMQYKTVADMLADTTGYEFFVPGDFVHVIDGDFSYRVLAEGALGHVSNAAAAPVQADVLSGGVLNVRAFGAEPGDGDSAAAIQAALDAWIEQLEAGEACTIRIDDRYTFGTPLLVSFTSQVVGGAVWDQRGGKLASSVATGTSLEFRVRTQVRGLKLDSLFIDGSGTDDVTVLFDGGSASVTPKEYLHNLVLNQPRVENAANVAMKLTGNVFESAIYNPFLICTANAVGTYALFLEDDATSNPSSIDIYGGACRGGEHALYSTIGDCKVFGGTYLNAFAENIFLKNSIGGGVMAAHVENAFEGNPGTDQAGIKITNHGYVRDCYGLSDNGNMDSVAKVYAGPAGVDVSGLRMAGGVSKKLIAVSGTGEIRATGVLRSESTIADLAAQRVTRFLNNGKVSRNASATGTITLDMDAQDIYDAKATGNVTFAAPINGRAGDELLIVLQQDATGGRTVTWNVYFQVKTAFDATASSRTSWRFFYTGGAWVEVSGIAGV